MTNLALTDRILTEDWQSIDQGWEACTKEDEEGLFIYFRKGELNARTQVEWDDLDNWPVEDLTELFERRFKDVTMSYAWQRQRGMLDDYDEDGNRIQ